jgi:uncharacterized protein YuzE
MRVTYDAESDAAFIYLVPSIGPGEAVRSRVCRTDLEGAAVIAVFDEHEHLLGIEILGASRALTDEGLMLLMSAAAGGE